MRSLHVTPNKITVLDHLAPFANAVNNVIISQFPIHIGAALWHYQYYKEVQYHASKNFCHIRDKAMKYQEKAVCVLSELENANFLGCLLSNFNKLKKQLEDKPKACADLYKALETYQGPVTESALNPHPNHWQSNPATLFHA
jgi:hypothetical protein